MTVTVKLITEQTTNQLVDSVNRAQADGWFPVCGVVCFNARYTQLMTLDTNATEVPKCNYFIVDSEDGVSFTQRVNQLLDINPGAVCLSSVQYAQARYIQAYGDDSVHSGSGGGGMMLPWYTQDAAGTYPIIDVDPNLSQIGLGNEWAGYVQLLFRTGGNNAGYILADDGTLSIHKTDGTELNIMNDDVNLLVKGTSVLNSNAEYTNLIANGSHVTLAPGYAGMSSPGGSLELDEARGIRLYGSDNDIILCDTANTTFGNYNLPSTVNGAVVKLDANAASTMEMDANATRFKRGTNQLMSMSDSGGTQTWNSMIRAAWNADGWNVSHDTGVSFSSRATYSMMQAKSGARVETNATGTVIVSSDSTSLQSAINLTNTSIVSKKGTTTSTLDAAGFTKDTAGEYHYNIDGSSVFFSSGDITKIEAGNLYLSMDDNTDEVLLPPTYTPTVSNSVATKGYVDNTRPVNAVFRASFTTTDLALMQYVTANNTPQVVLFNAQALPNAALGTLNNTTGVFTAARHIVGTLALSCQVRRTTGGAAAVTWGFQVETSPDGTTWTPTAGSARYINLRGAGDNNVLQTVSLTTAVDIPEGTRIRITQMTDTSSANVGLVALPTMLGGATAAGLVFSLITTL